MSRYQMERHLTDDALTYANVDVLCAARAEMQRAFDTLAVDAGLPDGARPLWRLSWEYVVEDDEPAEPSFIDFDPGTD